MNKKLCVVMMMAVIMLWGCSPDEKKSEAPAPEKTSAVEQTMDKAVEVTKEAKEKVVEASKEVAEASKAVEEKIEDNIGEKPEQESAVAVPEKTDEETTREVADATQAVQEAVEKRTEQEAAVAEQEKKVEEATQAVEEAVEEKAKQEAAVAEQEKKVEAAVAVQEEKVDAAVKMEEKAASVVEKDGQAATTTVETVVIDNKNGKVVLMHKRHAEAYGCTVCHGDQEPGPFELGKEKAHALCKGCHKEKNGPTSCNKCHQKKRKAVEGC